MAFVGIAIVSLALMMELLLADLCLCTLYGGQLEEVQEAYAWQIEDLTNLVLGFDNWRWCPLSHVLCALYAAYM